MRSVTRSHRVNQGTAKAVCDPESQADQQCNRNTLQIKSEPKFVSQDCESTSCDEDDLSGLSEPEEPECKTLVCGPCGKKFSHKFKLKRHIREVHRPGLNLVCEVCGKTSSSSGALYQHLKTHQEHECAECGRKFKAKKTLKSHWHRIHGDGAQVLRHTNVCSKLPKSKSGSGQVLLKCRDCDKTFKSAAGLSRHRATIHLQKFPHACNICGQAFTQKSSLLRHQRVHTKERPFQCSYCIGTFKDKWHLTQHERIHTGAKPYVCSICEKAYKLKIELREHIREIHENSERKCPECSYTCQTFGALASHWKLKHASEWIHKNSSKGCNSVHSNEVPSLSIEWRNKHAVKWATPNTVKKRERINIALLEELADASPFSGSEDSKDNDIEESADASSFSVSEDSMDNDSEELAMCKNSGT